MVSQPFTVWRKALAVEGGGLCLAHSSYTTSPAPWGRLAAKLVKVLSVLQEVLGAEHPDSIISIHSQIDSFRLIKCHKKAPQLN